MVNFCRILSGFAVYLMILGMPAPQIAAITTAMLIQRAVVSYFPPGIQAFPSLEQRAAPVAPDGYTPARVSCPAHRPTIRAATGLSTNETDWLPLRTNNTVQALKDVLSRANISDLDTGKYIDNLTSVGTGLPRVAIAISGGGYRALMNGAGALAAFDNRSTNATETGHLGGLLQSATYLSGLSGGSWLVGSLYVQNFTTVESIIFSQQGFLSTLWQFDNSILNGMNVASSK